MRKAIGTIVLALHVAFLLLFAVTRTPGPRAVSQPASTAFFLLPTEVTSPPGAAPTRSRALAAAARSTQRPARVAKSPPTRAPPQSPPESNAIASSPARDWQHELQIAANSQIQYDERKRRQRSVLAGHDFSAVKPGSNDDSRQEFGWDHSATHRVEEMSGGGLLINISDRCSVVWLIFAFPACKIGTLPARGDLFEHLKDAPEKHR